MKITDIYSRLKIVPLNQCLTHEGIVEKWAERIAANILDQGIVKNPIIAARHKNFYIIIDGMHRLAAFQRLELRDILVCEVDYFSEKIVLEGWDAFTFKPLSAKEFLTELFPGEEGYTMEECRDLPQAREALLRREHFLVAGDKEGKFYTLNKKNREGRLLLDELVRTVEKVDAEIDLKNLKVLYVENANSDEQFGKSDAASLVIRPQFTKEEIVGATLNKKLFPRKSTRHLIPDRPLRVDLNLSLLRANIDLNTKNQLLDEHLKWCFESGRVRFYPESVYVFSD